MLWCLVIYLRPNIQQLLQSNGGSFIKFLLLDDKHCCIFILLWCWSWNSNASATWWEELTRLQRPWCWKDWRQEEKGTTENEMVGWHQGRDGHVFEWTPGVGEGQGGLACYSPWGCQDSDTTGRLNWTDPLISAASIFRNAYFLSWVSQVMNNKTWPSDLSGLNCLSMSPPTTLLQCENSPYKISWCKTSEKTKWTQACQESNMTWYFMSCFP